MSVVNDLTVGFIGAGMMASAIMDGLVSSGAVSSPGKIACADPNVAFIAKQKEKGYIVTTKNSDVCVMDLNAIVICVKPQIVSDVCKDIMSSGTTDALIISVAAGVTLQSLEDILPNRRVVRVMPNTACLVGESASGFAMGSKTTSMDRDIVEQIFGAVGIALEQKEELLNAVTGLSGSGPAYVFQFIEALADAGVRVGLARNDALKLAAQTVKGAAEMVLVTGSSPAVLKDQVCSPGGTTIAGIDELEKGGLRSATINAVKAATRRSFQLGGLNDQEIATKYNL